MFKFLQCVFLLLKLFLQVEQVSTSTTTRPVVDSRCEGQEEGALVAIRRCSTTYLECSNSSSRFVECSGLGQVFSLSTRTCTLAQFVAECNAPPRAKPVSLTISASSDVVNVDFFCEGRADGFYRHPHNCSRVVQVSDSFFLIVLCLLTILTFGF